MSAPTPCNFVLFGGDPDMPCPPRWPPECPPALRELIEELLETEAGRAELRAVVERFENGGTQ